MVCVEWGPVTDERYRSLSGLAAGISHQKSVTLYTETTRRLADSRTRRDFASVAQQTLKELEFRDSWRESV